MGDGTEIFHPDDCFDLERHLDHMEYLRDQELDRRWEAYCVAAQAEIDQDIDAALLRVAANSSLADAVLLAGYLNRGHLFEKHTERCPTHEMEDAE